MRRLKTYAALASVSVPASAVVLDVHDRGPDQAPALLVSYDDADRERAERSFAILRPGETIPLGAQYVTSWRRNGCGPDNSGIFALFEIGADTPGDLPAEYVPHWRLLQRDGFTLRPDKAWLAPDDEPLSREQMVAVATLQECGYGSVVNA